MRKKTAIIIVKGRVQGVAFRYYTKNKARKLGLKGRVRNLEDKSVKIIVIGDTDSVDSLIDWCHKGSPASNVSEVFVEKGDEEMEEFVSFEIVR